MPVEKAARMSDLIQTLPAKEFILAHGASGIIPSN